MIKNWLTANVREVEDYEICFIIQYPVSRRTSKAIQTKFTYDNVP